MTGNTRFVAGFAPKPWISLLAFALAAAFAVGCVKGQAPFFIRLALAGIALLSLMVALGASVYAQVHVNGQGLLRVQRTLLGLPMNQQRYEPGSVKAVLFDRQLSAKSHASTGTPAPPTPRYRIDLELEKGSGFITASGDANKLSIAAHGLAQALGCECKKTGAW